MPKGMFDQLLHRSGMPLSMISEFLEDSNAAGRLAMVALALALFGVNFSEQFLHGLHHWLMMPVFPQGGILHSTLTREGMINDVLIALLFLTIGMEVKTALMLGALSSKRKATLPVAAALGGMAGPALSYFAIYSSGMLHGEGQLMGMMVPTATDIALVVAVMRLLGVAPAAQVFGMALAVADDLGAVVLIALFGGHAPDGAMLLQLGVPVVVLMLWCNLAGVNRVSVFLLLGTALWVVFFNAGLHATVAGVITGFMIPYLKNGETWAQAKAAHQRQQQHHMPHVNRPLTWLEHTMAPWMSVIIGVFVFANGGVRFLDVHWQQALGNVAFWGVLIGLPLGKTVGVYATVRLLTALNWAEMPDGLNKGQMLGLSMMMGIGLTMAIFMNNLVFASQPELRMEAQAAVLFGSVVSAVIGGMVYKAFSPKAQQKLQPAE